ncbi:MAG: hypothetical protein HC767_14720 [Akkermansiaceae bacterium]|nr:hypothetical protein [Akkermansiaceae bacterium]
MLKVEAASKKKIPSGSESFPVQAKPGIPLPYDERLGLTKEEYDNYLLFWEKRQFKPMEEVILMLRQSSSDAWVITSTGKASTLSTLRYTEKTDSFRSPNGEMKRIEDIKADSNNILGEWSGKEWKFEEETGLGKMKENFAIGRLGDPKLWDYRLSGPRTFIGRQPPVRQESRRSFPAFEICSITAI